MSFRSRSDGSHYPVGGSGGGVTYIDRAGKAFGIESADSVDSTISWAEDILRHSEDRKEQVNTYLAIEQAYDNSVALLKNGELTPESRELLKENISEYKKWLDSNEKDHKETKTLVDLDDIMLAKGFDVGEDYGPNGEGWNTDGKEFWFTFNDGEQSEYFKSPQSATSWANKQSATDVFSFSGDLDNLARLSNTLLDRGKQTYGFDTDVIVRGISAETAQGLASKYDVTIHDTPHSWTLERLNSQAMKLDFEPDNSENREE